MRKRGSDMQIENEIQELILKEPDESKRALLMTISKLIRVLTDNVQITATLVAEVKAQREEFENHVEDELKLINQGRGMLRVLSIILPSIFVVAQGAIGWFVFQNDRAVATNTVAVKELDAGLLELRHELQVLRLKLGLPEKN